jgi:hypothetical protein
MTQQLELIREATLKFRHTALNIFKSLEDKADVVPSGWKNNLRWHLGHLILTPHLLTYGLLKEDLVVPATWRPLFAKDTSPLNWTTGETVPSYEQLLSEFIPRTEALFESMAPRVLEPYPTPYTTTPGVVLESPLHSLNFSQIHDGLHVGMIFALRRALQ